MRRALQTIDTTPVGADALRKLTLFGRMPAELLKNVATQLITIRLDRLGTLQLEKPRAGYIYILVSGVLVLSARRNSFGSTFREIITTGEVFNLNSLVSNQTNRFQCKALTDSVIAKLRAKTFSELVVGVQLEKLRQVLELSIGRWWLGAPSWFSTTTELAARGRLSAMLVELSRKFGVRDSRGTIITLSLTRHALGELIGVSRQKVTMEIEMLAKAGKLVKEGKRLVVTKTLEKEWPLLTALD
jgi:CRP-like cAMP-binding protein